MNERQLQILSLRDTDVDGAVKRLCDDEGLYLQCLKEFLSDGTVTQLNAAVAGSDWDAAFTAAHALKGLAGNMGFVPLMHATSQLVILIRGGRTMDVPDSLTELNSCYRDIEDAIRQVLGAKDTQ